MAILLKKTNGTDRRLYHFAHAQYHGMMKTNKRQPNPTDKENNAMRADVQALVDDIRYALNCYGGIFDWDVALSRLDELNALSASHDL